MSISNTDSQKGTKKYSVPGCRCVVLKSELLTAVSGNMGIRDVQEEDLGLLP